MCPYLSSLCSTLDTQALAKLHQTGASKLRGPQKCTRWLRTSSECLWDFGVPFQLQIHIIVVKAMDNTTSLRIQSRGPAAISLSTFSHDPHIRTPCQRDAELDQPFGYPPCAESEPERLDRAYPPVIMECGPCGCGQQWAAFREQRGLGFEISKTALA